MLSALLAALATGLATSVGALPFLFARPSRRFYDQLLGLGAGLMLAAATLGLLTTALHDVRHDGAVDLARLGAVLAGFGAGVLLLYLMDRLIPHEHAGGHHVHVHEDHVHHGAHHHHRAHAAGAHDHAGHGHALAHAADDDEDGDSEVARKQGLLVVGVMSLHRVPEGFAIGAAWAAEGSRALGLLLAVAIGVQNAVEGAVMAAPLKRGGLGRAALLGLVTLTGLSVPLAALAGYLLSSRVAGALPPMLALAAGALLYLTCNEIIPESHSHGNEVRATFGVVAGFVLIILLQTLFGHEH